MPTSPRSSRGLPRRTGAAGARGFTLIEMLVTLVIMGLLAGLASLSIGGSTQRVARNEAERLVQVLGFASEEATYQGEEYGLLFEDDRYSVLRFDAESETWSEVTDKQLAAHTLPSSVRIELSLGDRAELPRSDKPKRRDEDAGESPRPEILVLSSGEISPFDLEFRAGDVSDPAARISSDGSGNLRQD